MSTDPAGSRSRVRERIRRVVDYCAKLGRRHRVADDVDLFTVLPTISRQFAAQHKFGSNWMRSGHDATAGAASI
jgi:hypothetical protein